MNSQDKNMFFIITEKTAYSLFSPGRICYMPESKYANLIRQTEPIKTLPVIRLGSKVEYDLFVDKMEVLTEKQAELLQALGETADFERLKWFKENNTLQTALDLTKNTQVYVEEDYRDLLGIIRYIGRLEQIYGDPISGVFFGVELQGKDKGKGSSNGTFKGKPLFSCPKNCGVFAPFSRVRPVDPTSLTSSVPQPSSRLKQTDSLSLGDRVTFFSDERYAHGMVMQLAEKEGQRLVRISTDTDENGKRGGEVTVPLGCVVKEEEPEPMDVVTPFEERKTEGTHPLDLSVNSLVEVSLRKGNAYGIIRWIGKLDLPGREETMAGLELEEAVGVSDGSIHGKQYFSCPPKKAIFVKLESCHPDSRFASQPTDYSDKIPISDFADRISTRGARRPENVAPISTERVNQVLVGRMKGIQGHCNSCYMDAALFSLFSCTSVLDSLLFKSTTPQDAPIQNTLLHDIVNPLRSQGFVEGRHIMKLRQLLQKHGYSHSFTTEEKDPEEFLTIIMQHILNLDPLLKLSAGGKVQESYYYQIFLDQNHSLVLPSVQQLLEHSFLNGGLKLAEVPSCLILQMPRFGKNFKMFDKIIPSLNLDITDLLSEGPQQCIMCGALAVEECPDCFKDPLFSLTGFKVFCNTCSIQVHSHPQRQSHRSALLKMPLGFQKRGTSSTLPKEKLQLFAVLCIETSHYVSFIKHGPNSTDWIFFDSMADRQGESDGFNIPQVQACPEVGMYLDMSPAELANQVPRDMKGVAKRLFCDAYMYLYQSNSMCIYR